MNKECIGLDAGTTYSIITYKKDDTIKTYSSISDGETINSLVAYHEKTKKFYYGMQAKTKGYDSKNILFKGFKMLMNEDNKDILNENHYNEFTPEEISEKFINHLIQSYLRSEKKDFIDTLYVGVPEIWFKGNKRKGRTVLENICKNIEYKHKKAIGEVQLVSEPEAACACFVVHNDKNRQNRFKGRCLVVDYGGGTLDIALCNVERDSDISDVVVEARCGIGANTEGKIGKAGLAYIEEVTKLSLMQYFDEKDIKKDSDFYRCADDIEQSLFFDPDDMDIISGVFDMMLREENIAFSDLINDINIIKDYEKDMYEDELLGIRGEYHNVDIELQYSILLQAYKNVIYNPLKEELNLMMNYMDEHDIAYSFEKINKSENFRVLMVGGFCNYILVREQIRDHFKAQPTDIRFAYQEKEPQKAIAYGLGYLANGLISFKRVAPYDIGIASSKDVLVGIAFRRGETYKIGVPKFISGGIDRNGKNVYKKFGGKKVPKLLFNDTILGEKNITAYPPTEHLEEELKLNINKVYSFGFSFDQNQVISLHKIEYDVDITKIGEDKYINPKETVIQLTDLDDWFGGIREIL